MIDHKKYNELKDEYEALKESMQKIDLSLKQLKYKIGITSISSKYISRYFTLKEVSSFYDKRYFRLGDRSREMEKVYTRQTFFYLSRQYGHSYSKIAKYFKMNHASVIHGCKKVSDYLFVRDTRFMAIFESIVKDFNNYLAEKGNEYLEHVTSENETDS